MPYLFDSTALAKYEKDRDFRDRVDSLFSLINEPVEGFARSHRLILKKWYQSQPLWLLQRHEEIVRHIYLAASQKRKFPALAVLIHAYRDDAMECIRSGLPKAILVSILEEPQLKEDPSVVTDALANALAKADELPETAFKTLGRIAQTL